MAEGVVWSSEDDQGPQHRLRTANQVVQNPRSYAPRGVPSGLRYPELIHRGVSIGASEGVTSGVAEGGAHRLQGVAGGGDGGVPHGRGLDHVRRRVRHVHPEALPDAVRGGCARVPRVLPHVVRHRGLPPARPSPGPPGGGGGAYRRPGGVVRRQSRARGGGAVAGGEGGGVRRGAPVRLAAHRRAAHALRDQTEEGNGEGLRRANGGWKGAQTGAARSRAAGCFGFLASPSSKSRTGSRARRGFSSRIRRRTPRALRCAHLRVRAVAAALGDGALPLQQPLEPALRLLGALLGGEHKGARRRFELLLQRVQVPEGAQRGDAAGVRRLAVELLRLPPVAAHARALLVAEAQVAHRGGVARQHRPHEPPHRQRHRRRHPDPASGQASSE
eukprot:1177723-Prorocentrum_minimum.AAC.3